ncbi:MAG: hypothetical protein KKA81_09720 [Bacteroidetes bacterium]|nr:hypothetical protein [Bacteroidota bacterium]
MNPAHEYEIQLNLHQGRLKRLRRVLSWFSLARIATFLMIFISIYLWASSRQLGWMIASLIFLALFIYFIRLYLEFRKKSVHTSFLVDINKNELDCLRGENSRWENGSGYSEHSSYAEDLDIFGKGSLFHLINRTGTPMGEKMLASTLKKPCLNPENILLFQKAISELSEKLPLRQELHAYALEGHEEERLQEQGENIVRIEGFPLWMRWLAPALIVSSSLFYAFTGAYGLIILSVLFNLYFSGHYFRKVQKIHKRISGKQTRLASYAAIFKLILSGDFRALKLKELQMQALEAHKGFHRLSGIAEMFDRRMNLLIYFFLNALYLYDFFCVSALKKWQLTYGKKETSWYTLIGQAEYFSSMATYKHNHPGFTFPVPINGSMAIHARDMGHPLIPAEKRTSNDIDIGKDSKILIITGSNMSGKSTFLRTLGINMVLARCGAPVCATSFEFKPLKVLTSIHLSDSLKENKSLFFTELERLSFIINLLINGETALVLIDEMLKGTNSDDKTQGSIDFIRRLAGTKCLALLATHDIQLGTLEKELPGSVRNYCFESNISNGELSFDYKIRPGISKNRNATFLMKKMGIIE